MSEKSVHGPKNKSAHGVHTPKKSVHKVCMNFLSKSLPNVFINRASLGQCVWHGHCSKTMSASNQLGKKLNSMRKVCKICATSLHKVCICRLDAHFSENHFRSAESLHIKSAQSVHLQTFCTLFNLQSRVCIKSARKSAQVCIYRLDAYLNCIWSSVCIKSAWSKKWSDIKCAHSLHQVCIWKVCVEFVKSLHKVFIRILKVCIKYACLYHWLITKCAWSAPDADFADLVHTHHVFGFLGWSVGQHMAHELM